MLAVLFELQRLISCMLCWAVLINLDPYTSASAWRHTPVLKFLHGLSSHNTWLDPFLSSSGEWWGERYKVSPTVVATSVKNIAIVLRTYISIIGNIEHVLACHCTCMRLLIRIADYSAACLGSYSRWSQKAEKDQVYTCTSLVSWQPTYAASIMLFQLMRGEDSMIAAALVCHQLTRLHWTWLMHPLHGLLV